ncbi:MAG: hypothetical protein ABI282_01660, partial [Candidatus Baltobacteraceae bacterium]
GFIPTVMLPQVTNRHVRGLRTRGTLGSSVAMLVMLGGVGIASILFFGARIIGVLVGNQFLGSAAFLPYYGVAMVFLALTNLLGSYGVATHRVAFAAPLVALVALMLAVIAFERQSVLAVVQTFMVGNALMCLSVTIALTIEGLRAIGRRESVA